MGRARKESKKREIREWRKKKTNSPFKFYIVYFGDAWFLWHCFNTSRHRFNVYIDMRIGGGLYAQPTRKNLRWQNRIIQRWWARNIPGAKTHHRTYQKKNMQAFCRQKPENNHWIELWKRWWNTMTWPWNLTAENTTILWKLATHHLMYTQRPTEHRQGSGCCVGIADRDFNSRYANHKQLLRKGAYSSQTELSKHVWQLNKAKVDHTIRWKILDRAQSRCNATKRCNLCTLEKFYIICKRELATINKRSELANTCMHANKFLLNNT